jgi:hypothetical protein
MSAEISAAEPVGLYVLEDRVISEPLKQDSLTRAAYSGNPGFTDGAEKPHPIYCAKNSLLAKPDIAEALEQVFLDGTPPREQFALEKPVDIELALHGLTWLKKNLDTDSILRHDAINTRAKLTIRQSEEEAAQQQAEIKAQTEIRIREEAHRAEQQAERKRKLKEAAQATHEADRQRQFDEVVDRVQGSFPELDFKNFFHLAGKLSSSEDKDGNIHIKEQKGFQSAINKRVEAFLQDPRELANDLSVLMLTADSLFFEQEGRDELPVAYACLNKIGAALTDAVRGNSYDNLPDEVIDQWFSVIETVTSPDNIPSDERRQEEARRADPKAAINIRKFGKRAHVVQKVLANSQVLSNSLRTIVKKDPATFVDRLYAFASRGLDPANELGFDIAMNAIVKCFKDPLVCCVVIGLTSSVQKTKPELQEPALDIVMTLRLAGVPWDQIYMPNSLERLNDKERMLLSKTVLPRDSKGAIDAYNNSAYEAAYQADESRYYAFEKRARTKEGRSTTLFGRLVEHTESNLSRPSRMLARFGLRNSVSKGPPS